jgi:hypothetical protein
VICLSRKEMVMMKKLILTLILSLIIMAGPAAPILKNVIGFGPTAAYAANDDNQGDNDDQGEDGNVDGQ